MSDLEAIVLVGGKGTRLRSVMSDRPKPMADVLGKPFLEWILLHLKKQGIKRVFLATGYKGEMVRNHFRDGASLGLCIGYSQEEEPLGTGGAVRKALAYLKSRIFYVLNGDSFCFFDASRMSELMHLLSADIVMWGVPCEDASQYGALNVDSEHRVLSFREKSATQHPGLINAGVYLLERRIIEDIPSDQNVSLEHEVFPSLIGRGFFACLGNGPFIDIGTPEAYALAEEFLSENLIEKFEI